MLPERFAGSCWGRCHTGLADSSQGLRTRAEPGRWTRYQAEVLSNWGWEAEAKGKRDILSQQTGNYFRKWPEVLS